ncbi:hypothetical protein LIER_37239 [Lithospermum erythrorhizon]|uniref:Uncharacterized protein n=1 Tax=Lithospermum erythrorhizon TaxID=34254 RepID=A0AAV3PJ91_LITER
MLFDRDAPDMYTQCSEEQGLNNIRAREKLEAWKQTRTPYLGLREESHKKKRGADYLLRSSTFGITPRTVLEIANKVEAKQRSSKKGRVKSKEEKWIGEKNPFFISTLCKINTKRKKTKGITRDGADGKNLKYEPGSL